MTRCLFVLLLLAASAPQALGRTTFIRAGRLIDPEAGTAAQNQVIVVEGGKVKAVGPNLDIPKGAHVIDLSRSAVLPGLFDAHTHLCMTVNLKRDAGNYFYTSIRDPDTYRAVQGVANARDMLAAGFTTVRDVGNAPDYSDTSLRMAIEFGWVPGPHVVNAGKIIAPFGGQWRNWPGRPDLFDAEYIYADTRDEMKKAVRENIYYGARVIKIVVNGYGFRYSVEDVKFLVEEAGRSGLRVAAHCNGDEDARTAILGGAASIEHGEGMTEETLRLAKERGVVLVGTDFPESLAAEQGYAPTLAPAFLERLRRAYKVGAPMAFGTDALLMTPEKSRGAYALDFLESYVKVGMRPGEILRLMTTDAARLVGVERERGALRPGMEADIIATPGNPLEDVWALRRVSFVMKGGKVFKRAE